MSIILEVEVNCAAVGCEAVSRQAKLTKPNHKPAFVTLFAFVILLFISGFLAMSKLYEVGSVSLAAVYQ
jgi:hypothetical protein